MKFGICTSFDQYEIACKSKAEFVEVNNFACSKLSEEEFEKVYDMISSGRLKAQTTNGLVPSDIRLTGPDVDYDKVREFSERSFARLKKLGVKTLVFGSSAAKQVPEGFSFDKAWEQLVEVGRIFSDVAKANGQTIAVEALNPKEVNIIDNLEDGAKLMKLVDRDNFKLLIDFYHLNTNGEDFNLATKYKDVLMHVHIANEQRKVFKNNPADLAYAKKCITALKDAGYDGLVSYEGSFPESVEEINDMMDIFKNCL